VAHNFWTSLYWQYRNMPRWAWFRDSFLLEYISDFEPEKLFL